MHTRSYLLAACGILKGSDSDLRLLWPVQMCSCCLCAQVFRTEIISRRLKKTATWPLMASALATVAVISIGAATITHPAVSCYALFSLMVFCRDMYGLFQEVWVMCTARLE